MQRRATSKRKPPQGGTPNVAYYARRIIFLNWLISQKGIKSCGRFGRSDPNKRNISKTQCHHCRCGKLRFTVETRAKSSLLFLRLGDEVAARCGPSFSGRCDGAVCSLLQGAEAIESLRGRGRSGRAAASRAVLASRDRRPACLRRSVGPSSSAHLAGNGPDSRPSSRNKTQPKG